MDYQIEVYKKASGVIPFDRWFEGLRDTKTKSVVLSRLDRVSLGNFGDSKYVDEGICELRINYGPGYRIYFAKSGTSIVLFLCAGNKSSQQKDIALAKKYLLDYHLRGKENAKNKKKEKSC